MKKLLFFVTCLIITGCTNNETHLLLSPDETIVFPNGTIFGGASEQQATALAKIIVKAQQGAWQTPPQKETAKQALALLEKMSKLQGSGEITLFFKPNSARLKENSMEYSRLINFLDYLIRESHGRKILLVSVGSSSGHKEDLNNVELSLTRSRAPLDTIEKYLVNTPHKIYEAYGVTDRKIDTEKNLMPKQKAMYRHTRIIAAFEEADLPLLPR